MSRAVRVLIALPLLAFLGLQLSPVAVAQGTLGLEPSRDITIIEDGSDGGGTGIYISTGVDSDGDRHRTLLAFDDLSGIPDDMVVLEASLSVFVNLTQTGEVPVELYRLTAEWNENNARWGRRMMSQNWANAGGDFVDQASAQTQLAGADQFYTFDSTSDLAADIEFWRQNPGQNFGWIMIASEPQGQTFKRMASSEMGSPVFRPELSITYGPAPQEDDFVINFGLSGGWFNADTAGQGLLLEVLPESEQVFVTWFTYESEGAVAAGKVGATEHRWLSGLGAIDGNRVEVDLRVTSGGFFDDPTPVERTESGTYGTLTLEFTDCASATMSYDLFDEGLQGQRDLIRLGPAPQTCSDLAAR